MSGCAFRRGIMESSLNGWSLMPTSTPPQLTAPDANYPLGVGLRSTPEPLQRWCLIGRGNPYFDSEAREVRCFLGISEAGFENETDFVNWVALRWSRHGHVTAIPTSLTVDGQFFDGHENLTRFHHRNISWPIKEHEIPGPCCPTDPLFYAAKRLAARFGIQRAGSEPGFPGPTEAVVGFLLVNRWPHVKSLRGIRWTEEYSFVDHTTHESYEEVNHVTSRGLKARGGAGKQLPLWYVWWKLFQEKKKISEISRLTDSDVPGSKTYDERSIRLGIDAVERLMQPVEKPSIS